LIYVKTDGEGSLSWTPQPTAENRTASTKNYESRHPLKYEKESATTV